MWAQARFRGACMVALAFGMAGVPRTAYAQGAGKLYAIIVIDTSKEADIQEDVIKDAESWAKALRNDIPSRNLEAKVLRDRDASLQGISEYLARIQPSANDALLLAVSCHGGTIKRDQDHHVLQLQGRGLENVRRADLREMLRGKGARLTVLISDACSLLPDDGRPEPPKPPDRKISFLADGGPAAISPGYRKLFFEASGLVDVNGAYEGWPAWSDPVDGGIFSRSVVATLQACRNDAAVTWPLFYSKLKVATADVYKEWRPEQIKVYEMKELRGRLPRGEQEAYDFLKKQPTQTPQAFFLAGVTLGVGVQGTDGNGVEVIELQLNSPLRKAGIKVGQVILQANDKSVVTVAEWEAVMKPALKAGQVRHKFTVSGRDSPVEVELNP